jgi:hypothetical protein
MGSIVSIDGRSKREIKKRICQAKIAFNKKKKKAILLQKISSNTPENNVLKIYQWSIMLYGNKT